MMNSGQKKQEPKTLIQSLRTHTCWYCDVQKHQDIRYEERPRFTQAELIVHYKLGM